MVKKKGNGKAGIGKKVTKKSVKSGVSNKLKKAKSRAVSKKKRVRYLTQEMLMFYEHPKVLNTYNQDVKNFLNSRFNQYEKQGFRVDLTDPNFIQIKGMPEHRAIAEAGYLARKGVSASYDSEKGALVIREQGAAIKSQEPKKEEIMKKERYSIIGAFAQTLGRSADEVKKNEEESKK